MASKSTVKIAGQLLDRFFRDAEGRTNRQIDVYFALEDMQVTPDKAAPALEYLKSRGLVNLFGSDIGFLTDLGVQAMVDEVDIGSLDKEVRDFVQKPVAAPAPAEPKARPAGAQKSPRPARAQLTHIDLEGGEFTLKLEHRCRIGRADDNEVRINDKRASKHHAELVYDNGRYLLVDLESANGTLLNGDYALEPIPLKHDDEIVIGRTMLLYQAPEVVQAPAPKVEAPPEPEPVATPVAPRRPYAPTERPAAAAVEVDPSPSIRVVKGTPAAPPSADHRAPIAAPSTSAGPDLFAEPPTRAPSTDLFAEPGRPAAEPVPNEDLFGDDAPTQMPPTRRGGNLFEDDPAPIAGQDLFADDGVGVGADPEADQDLFSDPMQGDAAPEDLFAEPSPPAGDPSNRARPDPSGGLELGFVDRLAPAPQDPMDVLDTVASDYADPKTFTPAPEVDDLWDGDVTPTSDQDGLIDNAPVHFDASTLDTLDTPPSRDDASTLMMDRDALAAYAPDIVDELPRWASEDELPELSEVEPLDPLDAATEAITAEDLPEASPSLAMPALSQEAEQTIDADGAHPEFYALLTALKAHARQAHIPDGRAVIEAIECLESHPYVRQALKSL